MRWRFVDRVTAFDPWGRIAGRKAASLEEYSLLERHGRPGEVAGTLVLESAVQLAGWLVMASSGFRQAALLEEVRDLRLEGRVGAGDAVEMTARVEGREDGRLDVSWEGFRGGEKIAGGRMALALVPLEGLCDPGRMEPLWKELYAPA